LEEENVDENSFIEFEFVAQCMVNTKLSVVQIWVTDCSDDDGTPSFLDESDNAEIPECCHPGEKQCKTVEYTFKLPCVSPCPEDEVTTLPIADKAPDGAKEAPNRPAKEASGGHRNLALLKIVGFEDFVLNEVKFDGLADFDVGIGVTNGSAVMGNDVWNALVSH